MTEIQDKIKQEKVISLVTKLNISKDDLIEFLKKNGIEASLNTTLPPEIVSKVFTHYHKEIEKEQKRKEKVKKFEETLHTGLTEGTEMIREEEDMKRKIAEEERARKAIEEENRRKEDEKKKQELQAYLQRKTIKEKEKEKTEKPPRHEKPKTPETRTETTERPKRPEQTSGPSAPRRHTGDQRPERRGEHARQSGQRQQGRESSSEHKQTDQRRHQGAQGKKPFHHQKKDARNKITLKDLPGKKKFEPETPKSFPDKPAQTTQTGEKGIGEKKIRDRERDRKKFEQEQERKRKQKQEKTHRAKDAAQKEIDEAIRETFAKMETDAGSSARSLARKRKKKERIEEERKILEQKEASKNILKVNEFVSTAELANLMGVDPNDIIKACFKLGMMVSINQRLEKDLIELILSDFGMQVEFLKEYEEEMLEDVSDEETSLKSRAPVVTVMGHVDHGKTSLLDYLRKANVVAGEAGGITQHIGAYKVLLDGGKSLTFLDTPGHEAFTAMRARGGQAADIVVLVVAADDSVMPQTVEAINHARAAGVPIVIAINKVDKPESNPEKIKQQLADKDILVEDWGGKYQSVEISAKFGKNIESLLEKILVEAELLDLKANPDRDARGVVLEAKLDKGKGPIATVLVQKGTLEVGDSFISGMYNGKVKAMFDEREQKVDIAHPSTPVVVLGFDGVPQAGDSFIVLDSERDAKAISLKRQQLKREQDVRQMKLVTLDDISKRIKEGQEVELRIILKADTDGSAEALADSLHKLTTRETKVSVIHKAVGAITESDILLAEASGAVVIGFNVRPNLNARKLAEKNKIDIRLYDIIYKLIEEVKQALEGMLAPDISEEVVGTVEVRQVFKVPKIGNVAGCYVVDGKVSRNNKVRLIRDGFMVFEGGIASLRRIKDDVREVEAGYECGIGLENFNDIKVGDIIESYKLVETKRKLVTQ